MNPKTKNRGTHTTNKKEKIITFSSKFKFKPKHLKTKNMKENPIKLNVV